MKSLQALAYINFKCCNHQRKEAFQFPHSAPNCLAVFPFLCNGFRQFNILNNGSSSSPDLHFQITGVLDLHQSRGPEVTCIVLRLNEGPFSIQSEENRAVA
ncbi:hypothetical protein P8452_38561 [Trifolium repens]|nr:hypothetical protein P8452_38561 [Trifolium repens]